MYKFLLKRVLDIFCAIAFFICFWWLYLVVAFLIKKNLGSPVIFKQERPGLNGKIFTMYKFRSLNENSKRKNDSNSSYSL